MYNGVKSKGHCICRCGSHGVGSARATPDTRTTGDRTAGARDVGEREREAEGVSLGARRVPVVARGADIISGEGAELVDERAETGEPSAARRREDATRARPGRGLYENLTKREKPDANARQPRPRPDRVHDNQTP